MRSNNQLQPPAVVTVTASARFAMASERPLNLTGAPSVSVVSTWLPSQASPCSLSFRVQPVLLLTALRLRLRSPLSAGRNESRMFSFNRPFILDACLFRRWIRALENDLLLSSASYCTTLCRHILPQQRRLQTPAH